MSGVTILINKADNTFTVCIEKDFHRWAGDPTNDYSGLLVRSVGQQNINWIKDQLNEFLESQWAS